MPDVFPVGGPLVADVVAGLDQAAALVGGRDLVGGDVDHHRRARHRHEAQEVEAAAGVRLNAVAPGITMTPLTERVYADAELGSAMKEFGDMVPVGRTAQPADIANVMRFMLSDEASYLCGSLFFVDGGSDAMLRPDDF